MRPVPQLLFVGFSTVTHLFGELLFHAAVVNSRRSPNSLTRDRGVAKNRENRSDELLKVRVAQQEQALVGCPLAPATRLRDGFPGAVKFNDGLVP
jgi:hypothetical protein